MVMFTTARLKQFAPKSLSVEVDKICLALEQFSSRYGLTTPRRIAHFMGQLSHESVGFTRLYENLNYSADRLMRVWPRLAGRADILAHNPEALGNAAYANRIGNGDEASGDGYRYRGRGYIQLTGRANYRTTGETIGLDLENNPKLAAQIDIAVEIALSFWQTRKCNVSADIDSVEGVTRLINGSKMFGLEERRTLTAKAKTIFTADTSLIS